MECVFLGSSGAIQVPAFFCDCAVCEGARRDLKKRRTRASLALLGRETVLIDTSPDLDAQLEREGIRRVDRVFLTHWHFDHVGGLAALGEPKQCAHWPQINLHLPKQEMHHFEEEMGYFRNKVNLHPLQPGDRIELPDATWEVVKTTHTDDSVGFILEAGLRFAYLVDGVVPPPATIGRLHDVDVLVIEATMDELDRKGWLNFCFREAVDFWRSTGIERCILTHLSCHSWENDRLVAGFSDERRRQYEAQYPGLTFACDGMRLTL